MCFWALCVFLSLFMFHLVLCVSLSPILSLCLCLYLSPCLSLSVPVSAPVSVRCLSFVVSLLSVSLSRCLCPLSLFSVPGASIPSSSSIWSAPPPSYARPPGGSTDRPPRAALCWAQPGFGLQALPASLSHFPIFLASSRLCSSPLRLCPFVSPRGSRSSPAPPTSSHSLGCPGGAGEASQLVWVRAGSQKAEGGAATERL